MATCTAGGGDAGWQVAKCGILMGGRATHQEVLLVDAWVLVLLPPCHQEVLPPDQEVLLIDATGPADVPVYASSRYESASCGGGSSSCRLIETAAQLALW